MDLPRITPMDWLNIIVVMATIIGALYLFAAKAKESIRDLKDEIRSVKDELHGEVNNVRSEIHDLKKELKIDIRDLRAHLETDIAAVRKDVNRNTSHLSNIEEQITQLTRPNIIRIEREDIEKRPLSDTATKLKDMAN